MLCLSPRGNRIRSLWSSPILSQRPCCLLSHRSTHDDWLSLPEHVKSGFVHMPGCVSICTKPLFTCSAYLPSTLLTKRSLSYIILTMLAKTNICKQTQEGASYASNDYQPVRGS